MVHPPNDRGRGRDQVVSFDLSGAPCGVCLDKPKPREGKTMACNKETEKLFSYLAPLLCDLEDEGLDLSKIDWGHVADWYQESPRIQNELDHLASLDI